MKKKFREVPGFVEGNVHVLYLTRNLGKFTPTFPITANKNHIFFQLDFKTDDVIVPDIPGMFTTVHAKNNPLFIEARHFNDPKHYAKMMGYDKPMDFKLGEQNASDK